MNTDLQLGQEEPLSQPKGKPELAAEEHTGSESPSALLESHSQLGAGLGLLPPDWLPCQAEGSSLKLPGRLACAP